jgi:hypothetical protein
MKLNLQPPNANVHKMNKAGFRICRRLEAVRTDTILADRYAGLPPGFTFAESCSAIKPCLTLSHVSCPRKVVTGFSGGGEWFTDYSLMEMSNVVYSSSA